MRTGHVAARIEDLFGATLSAPMRRRGWRPKVIGYTGYGVPGRVRVVGRVLLAPPRLPGTTEAQRPDPQRGWRAFATLPVRGAEVIAEVGGRRHVLTTDRGGYVEDVVEADLGPGWYRITLTLKDQLEAKPRWRGQSTACSVRIVDPAIPVGIVSDIDDTVMVTALPRPLIAAWNTFVLREYARRPVPGMAGMLRAAQDADPGALVVYLSTGAWNVAPTLERFLARHGFPPGPLLLTDWGPTKTTWFREGVAHKRTSLERLTQELPSVRWLLVGDDGQHDPEIYGGFARDRPDAVRGIAIRHLSPTEQVLSRGIPAPASDAVAGAAATTVPWVIAPDGTALEHEARTAGLL